MAGRGSRPFPEITELQSARTQNKVFVPWKTCIPFGFGKSPITESSLKGRNDSPTEHI